MTEQQRPSGEGEERAERLPPEVQGESAMGQETTVVPSAGAPSLPMEQPDDSEGDPPRD